MKITEYRLFCKDELLKVLNNTHLRGDPSIKPYADAEISVQTTQKSAVVPTQRFVLQEQLDTIRNLHKIFAGKGIDIFNNPGFITYTIGKENFTLTPPIIEVIENKPLLIDGMHRIIYFENSPFTAIFIKGIRPEFYPYQIGLKRGWQEVWTFESEVPENFPRKERRYSMEESKHYFREYPFPGIIKIPRRHTTK